MRRPWLFALPLLAVLPLAAWGEEEEKGGNGAPPVRAEPEPIRVVDGWPEMASVPGWVLAPPPREGWIRIVAAGRSNLLKLAYGFFDEGVRRSVRHAIAWRLRPLLGADADAAAKASVAKPVQVRKAFHRDPATPGSEMTPGGTTCIAWVLWEVPSAPVLEAIAADKREAARAALARTEPADVPKWDSVEQQPDWVAKPPTRAGHLTLAIEERATRPDVAKADAILFAGSRVGGEIAGRLRKLLGGEDAWAAGWAAARWRVPVKRALGRARGKAAAWTLWEVPLDPVLAAVPPESREKARAAVSRARVKR